MISDIKRLKNIADILNCEGTILGLHQSGDKLLLSSHLEKGDGSVYYSTTKVNLLQYLNSEITLKELYLKSEDVIVTREFRREVATHLKEEFTDKITCGERYYNDCVRNGLTTGDPLDLGDGL